MINFSLAKFELEEGESEGQGHPLLHNKMDTILGKVRLAKKKKD